MPVYVEKTGLKKVIGSKWSEDEVNRYFTEFGQKLSIAPMLASCDSWSYLDKILPTGGFLNEFKQIDGQLYDAYGDYQQSGRSVYYMNRYNEIINTVAKPFLSKIGANPQMIDYMIITEEKRQREIADEKKWMMEEIKKARNTWVDNNPQEARRRGITKF